MSAAGRWSSCPRCGDPTIGLIGRAFEWVFGAQHLCRLGRWNVVMVADPQQVEYDAELWMYLVQCGFCYEDGRLVRLVDAEMWKKLDAQNVRLFLEYDGKIAAW